MTGSGNSPATCLGCGCACDDIALRVEAARIVEAGNACALGAAWFGDGTVPARVRVSGANAALDDAIEAAARMLAGARRPLIYLAPDISCEAQREATGIADVVRAVLDSVTSSTVMTSVLAAQELGRASATLGEVRNRADVLVFWGVDPDARYPRYRSRYAPEPAGVHVPDGRRSRTVVAVDIGECRGPADADLRVAIDPADEVAVLILLRESDRLKALSRPVRGSDPRTDRHRGLTPLAEALRAGTYVVFVADAEPDGLPDRDPGRAAALIALTQALNATTRAALSTLRAGGNRSGADAAMTSQTGYPAAVEFSRGYPRYRPHDAAAARLARRQIDAVLLLGSSALVPADVLPHLPGVRCAAIGPRASEGPLAAADVVVDTAVAGIHEAGTALRMDDVPLPLMAAVPGPPATVEIARRLRARVSLHAPGGVTR